VGWGGLLGTDTRQASGGEERERFGGDPRKIMACMASVLLFSLFSLNFRTWPRLGDAGCGAG
jgi:hypothetical protein